MPCVNMHPSFNPTYVLMGWWALWCCALFPTTVSLMITPLVHLLVSLAVLSEFTLDIIVSICCGFAVHLPFCTPSGCTICIALSGWKGKGEKEKLFSILIKLILIKKSSPENSGLQWFEKEIPCKGLILIRSTQFTNSVKLRKNKIYWIQIKQYKTIESSWDHVHVFPRQILACYVVSVRYCKVSHWLKVFLPFLWFA